MKTISKLTKVQKFMYNITLVLSGRFFIGQKLAGVIFDGSWNTPACLSTVILAVSCSYTFHEWCFFFIQAWNHIPDKFLFKLLHMYKSKQVNLALWQMWDNRYINFLITVVTVDGADLKDEMNGARIVSYCHSCRCRAYQVCWCSAAPTTMGIETLRDLPTNRGCLDRSRRTQGEDPSQHLLQHHSNAPE